MASLILLAGGLVLLAAGGEVLIRGAVLLARLAGLSAAVIGLTVVAAGTSLPELAVSLEAALRGGADLAVANVIGSNILNISFALGLTALLSPLPVHSTAIRLEWPVMFGSAVVCTAMLADSWLSRGEAALLVLALVAFVAFSVRLARLPVSNREEAEFKQAAAARALTAGRRRGWLAVAGVLLGAVLLVSGGSLVVRGATGLARMAGLSERIVGLTVVAIGTGMPELATSLVAALRRRADVAVANMIGSNIFNLLGILGATALVRPIQISPQLVRSDALWMIATSVLLLPVLWSGGRIRRWEGAILAAVYVAYLASLIL